MDPVEVLAIAVQQYVGQGIKTLVPRVIGQTTETQRKSRGSTPGKQWDKNKFFQTLETYQNAEVTQVARSILEWAKKRTRIVWGRGQRSGSFVPILTHKDRDHQLFAVWTYSTVEIYFYWYQYKAPFDAEAKRKALLRRLNAIEDISLPEDAISRRPGIPMSTLVDEQALTEFLGVFDWVIDQIQAV